MTSQKEDFKTYLFSYDYQGKSWGFDIQATSPEDAIARLSRMRTARLDGALVLSIPVPDIRRSRVISWLSSIFKR